MVGDAAGWLLMLDLQKQLQLSAHKAPQAVVAAEYWPQQRLFASCTADGSLVLNGFGARKPHLALRLSKRPLHALALLGEHRLALGADDGAVLLVDVRRAELN